jgi:hypothetical protein
MCTDLISGTSASSVYQYMVRTDQPQYAQMFALTAAASFCPQHLTALDAAIRATFW